VALLTGCGDPSTLAEAFWLKDPGRATPEAEVDAVLVFCDREAPGSGRGPALALVARGARDRDVTPETIRLPVDRLRGRVLIVEFGPMEMDIVLATPDFRDVARLHRVP
jgi:hypothetical protein